MTLTATPPALKPCPRCGTIPKLGHDYHAIDGDRYWTTCECRTDWKLPLAEAIAASNRRASGTEAALREASQELLDAIEADDETPGSWLARLNAAKAGVRAALSPHAKEAAGAGPFAEEQRAMAMEAAHRIVDRCERLRKYRIGSDTRELISIRDADLVATALLASEPDPRVAALELAIERIIQDVCELPDRTSPEDQLDMMLVTVEELDMILRRHLGFEDAALASPPRVAALLEALQEVEREAVLPGYLKDIVAEAIALASPPRDGGKPPDPCAHDWTPWVTIEGARKYFPEMSESRVKPFFEEYKTTGRDAKVCPVGYRVGARYKSDNTIGSIADVYLSDGWLIISTDDYEGVAMLHVEALPHLRRALNRLTRHIKQVAAVATEEQVRAHPGEPRLNPHPRSKP